MSKPMTKTQLVAALADAMGADKKVAGAALDAVAEVVAREVAAGGAVTLPGLGKVGYVANSTHTVLGDCYSAGRIYDKIGAAATAKVKYVLANAVVCSVKAADMGQAGLPPVDPATGLPFGSEEDAIAF